LRKGLLRVAALALIAALGAGAARGAAASSPQEKFAAGNAAYDRGGYLEAITLYEGLLSSGLSSAALQYNLGNALFKAGRLGEAILAYERARRLDPRDPDIQANLDYLRTLTVDRIPPASSPLTALGIAYVMDLTSADQDAQVTLAAWLLAGLALAVAQAARREGPRKLALYAAAALMVPVLLCGGDLALKSYLDATRSYGVVMEREVNVLSGAGEENPTLFTVHEGLKVRLRSRAGEWAQVSLDNGLVGWLPSPAVKEI
jgi:tetratricopeptide (TPR) repeat protein